MLPQRHHPPHPSTFARVGVLVYGLLIIYASLYPFSGWHDNGIAPWAFLSAPLPYYWTGFDVVTNIVGYIPLGMLAVLALYPRVRGVAALLIATAGCVLMSGAMEGLQTFLPSRVSSNLDFYTNSGGGLIGALIGWRLSHALLEQSMFLILRRRWFLHDAGRGLIVAGLWPLAQIYPQGYLFGHGQLMPALSDFLSDWLESPVDLGALLRHGLDLSIEQFWLAETIIAACGLTGAMLLLLVLLRPSAPRVRLFFGLLLLTLAFKSLASALLFAPSNAFAWITPGAEGGLLFGSAMLFGLTFAPPVAQRRIAAAMLAIALLIVNIIPPNPYFVATMQTWIQGKFLNFNGAAHFLSLFWPYLAIWFLLHHTHRKKRAGV